MLSCYKFCIKPNNKNQNRFKYGQNDNQRSNTHESHTSSEQNPYKRYRPNSTDDGDSDPNISDLSAILKTASSNPDSLKKITTLTYTQQHTNKNKQKLIIKSLIPEFDLMKTDTSISELHQRIDDLEQYSRKNCLKFSGVPEPT